MSTTHTEDQINSVLSEGADSVVLYRHPQSHIKHLLIGNAITLKKGLNDEVLEKSGFLMYPFKDDSYDPFFIYNNYSDEFSNDLSEESNTRLSSFFNSILKDENDEEADYTIYKKQFVDMHKAICKGDVEKVILSRIKKENPLSANSIIALFDKLCELYPHAFIYVMASPVSGLWIGAGPELLLKKENQNLQSVSLAGTLVNSIESEWSEKEIVEQALVTQYMEEKLRQNGVVEYKKNGPYSASAGQVKHLRTDFVFDMANLNDSVSHLLTQLHPTPAVCGMAKHKAIKLINKCEGHNRAYYAGFLGPVDKGNFSLYVNIRCMKLGRNYTALYLGGGLTKASAVEKEWEETNLKAQTLLSVIKNVSNLQGYE